MENEQKDNNNKRSIIHIIELLKELKKDLLGKKLTRIQVLEEISRIQEEIKTSNLEKFQTDFLQKIIEKSLFKLLGEIYPKDALGSAEEAGITSIYNRVLSEGMKPETPEQIAISKYRELKDLSYEMREIETTEKYMKFIGMDSTNLSSLGISPGRKEIITKKKKDILDSLSLEERKILSKEFVRDVDSLLENINTIIINYFNSKGADEDAERKEWQRIGKRTHQIVSWGFLPDEVTKNINLLLKDFDTELESKNLNLGILMKLANTLQHSKSPNIFNS